MGKRPQLKRMKQPLFINKSHSENEVSHFHFNTLKRLMYISIQAVWRKSWADGAKDKDSNPWRTKN